MILSTTYIDDLGFVKTTLHKISHNIVNNDQLDIFKKVILKKYNESVLFIREISDYGVNSLDGSALDTKELFFKLPSPNLSILRLPEPAYGSALECIMRNLTIETQIECHKVQSYFESIRISLLPIDTSVDKITIGLSEIRSSGVYTHLYDIKLSFTDEWSSTCDSCQKGALYLRNELNKLMDNLYISQNPGYEYRGKIISDLEVNNKDLLKDQISILLSNALSDARVSDFTIVDSLIGEDGDET